MAETPTELHVDARVDDFIKILPGARVCITQVGAGDETGRVVNVKKAVRTGRPGVLFHIVGIPEGGTDEFAYEIATSTRVQVLAATSGCQRD